MIRKPGDLPDDTLLGRGHERRAFEFPGRGPLLEPPETSVLSNGRFEWRP